MDDLSVLGARALRAGAKAALAKALYLKRSLALNRKIRHIYNLNKAACSQSVDRRTLLAHEQKWSPLKKRIDVRWLKIYSAISGQASPDFVPEDIYFLMIEPRLNNADLLFSYKDKNFYELYYAPKVFPRALLRNIDGVYYDGHYNVLKKERLEEGLNSFLEPEKKIIVKPATATGGGSNVRLFVKQGDAYRNEAGMVLSLASLSRRYGRNFIVQKYIEQHPYFRQFNSTSLNTVRVLTYRSVATEEVHALQAVQRMGRKGSLVDNQAAGGLSCGIGADGTLKSFAVDKYGAIYPKSDEGLSFNQARETVQFEVMKSLAREIARKTYYARVLGFDFCVDENGDVILIEINNRYLEINFLQMNNGPLFAGFTDEVIQFCSGGGSLGRRHT
jgi:hypothetical protein